MKRLILLLLFVFFPLWSSAMSVVPDTLSVPDHLLEPRFSQLDMSGVNTGILYDQGYTPVDYRSFDGSSNCSYSSDISTFYNILKGVRSSVVSSSVIVPVADSVMVHMSNHLENTGRIPVGIAVYNYNQIVPNALRDSLVAFQTVNGEPVLVNLPQPGGAYDDVYEECTFAACSPYLNVVPSSVTFDFSSLFRFTNRTITGLYFDPGDNTGFHQITANGTYSVVYSTPSVKNIRVKIVLNNNEEVFSHCIIMVKDTSESSSGSGNDPFEWDVETFTSSIYSDGVYPQGKISIRYANGTSFSKQPMIVAECFDPISDALGLIFKDDDAKKGYGAKNIRHFSGKISQTDLNNHDIIYVDWLNSTCSIESNADILIQILGWVNERKPAEERSILIGQSMGGLIARYALRYMEQHGQHHEVSTYVSHDSPHLGANIPIGYMYLLRWLLGTGTVFNYNPLFNSLEALVWAACAGIHNMEYLHLYTDELFAFRDGTGVKQMLKYYVNNLLEIDTSTFDSFQGTLHSIGFPQGDAGHGILNLCITNGGVNNYIDENPFLSIGHSSSITISNYLSIEQIFHSLITGETWNLSGTTSYGIDDEIQVNPFLNPGDYLLEVTRTIIKQYSWGYPQTYYSVPFIIPAPSSVLAMDSVYGSYYEIPGIGNIGTSLNTLLSNWDYHLSLQDKFVFVPTVSSLCLGGNGGILDPSLYTYDYASSGPSMNDIPFDGYRFHSSGASRHIDLSTSDVSFFCNLDGIQVLDSTITSTGNKKYYLNKPGLSVTWSSSNTNVATINANTGELTPQGFGDCWIYATFTYGGGHVRLKKKFSRNPPATITFPTYTLSARDMTPPQDYTNDSYRIDAMEQLSGAHIPDSLMSFVKYCWGRKMYGSSTITWNEGTSLRYNVTLPLYEDHNFYFRVKYRNTYSTTYSIHCLSLPRMIPVDPLGNLYTEDMGEVIVQLKGGATSESVTFRCMGIEAVFDHVPTMAELCRRLLDYNVFVTEVKKLKPWGDEDTVIIPYSYTVGDSSESVQEVMVFQYNPLIQ